MYTLLIFVPISRCICICVHDVSCCLPTHFCIRYAAWDLLRIDVQGFTEFCSDFLSRQRGYFVSPLRLSGSAVESIFGQFKYNARGKLDAANYQVARAALLTKQASECHHSGKGYRDVPLYVQEVPIERKVYRRKQKTKKKT